MPTLPETALRCASCEHYVATDLCDDCDSPVCKECAKYPSPGYSGHLLCPDCCADWLACKAAQREEMEQQ